MPLADFAKRILSVGETLYQWLALCAGLDQNAREKVALYAEEVAATLARAAAALTRLEKHPMNQSNALRARPETS